MSQQERNNDFHHIVLSALWCIILLLKGKDKGNHHLNVRSSMIAFGDTHGVPGDDAKAYRRDATYWWS